MIGCLCREIISMIMVKMWEGVKRIKGMLEMRDKMCLIEIKRINEMKEINYPREMIKLIAINQDKINKMQNPIKKILKEE